MLVLSTLELSTASDSAAAAPRSSWNRTSSDGVWQKRYGWGGYGRYSIYGDFVGNDGYTWINYGNRGTVRGGQANQRDRTNFDRTSSYGMFNFPN
jgi:hypothetical protein